MRVRNEMEVSEMDTGLSLEAYRRDAIKAAKELFYGDDVIDELMRAQGIYQMDAILGRARGNTDPATLKNRQRASCLVVGKKLNSEQVEDIRTCYIESGGKRGTINELATRYGVTRYAIYKIVNDIRWK